MVAMGLQVAGLDAYEAMPVELFGEAMLRGMGWEEGRCVGKNSKGVRIQFCECVLTRCQKVIPKSVWLEDHIDSCFATTLLKSAVRSSGGKSEGVRAAAG